MNIRTVNQEINTSAIRRKLFLLGLFKIPIIGFVHPKLQEISTTTSIVSVSLRRRTRNHLNSMYLGALVVGAEVAAGIFVFYWGEQLKQKYSFVFQAAASEYLKRADSKVRFVCNDGELLKELFRKSAESGERVSETVLVEAFNVDNELVAKFQFTISLKVI